MTPRYDWDMDRIHEATWEGGMTFNTIFRELWDQAEAMSLGLLPEDLEAEADRIHDDMQADAWKALPDDVRHTVPAPLALIGRR